MKTFSSLLERVAHALHSDSALKEAVRSSIQASTGALVDLEAITLKEGVLTVCASPALKNEVMLKSEKIKNEILEKTGTRILTIRFS